MDRFCLLGPAEAHFENRDFPANDALIGATNRRDSRYSQGTVRMGLGQT